MQSEARAAGLDRVKVVSHLPAEDFYQSVGAVRIGTSFANPPAVPWDRPELEFRIPFGMTRCAGSLGTGFSCMVAVMQEPLDAVRSVCAVVSALAW